MSGQETEEHIVSEVPAEHTLLGTDDPMVWSQEFCRIFKGYVIYEAGATVSDLVDGDGRNRFGPWLGPDMLVGWFANAMQTAVNLYERKKLNEKEQVTFKDPGTKEWGPEHAVTYRVDVDEGITLMAREIVDTEDEDPQQ